MLSDINEANLMSELVLISTVGGLVYDHSLEMLNLCLERKLCYKLTRHR